MQEGSVYARNTGYGSPPSQERNPIRHEVRKIVSYAWKGKRFLTLTIDLGLDGLKLTTEHRLPQDQPLEIQLVLGHKSIYLRGRVVFNRSLSRRQRVSDIQFMDLSRKDKKLLQDYLSTVDL